ncbi:MAG: DUF3604 domain-containing protein [Parvibaculales bacterium]
MSVLKYRKTLIALSGLIVLVGGYIALGNITKYPLDKSVEIKTPTSVKSLPAEYAFGFDPGFQYSEAREPCAVQHPTKKAYFGDLHVHTALSADAYPDGTRLFPADAYRFAKGERVMLPSPEGGTEKTLQLMRPLDFVAVTDHSDTFGEGYICRTPGAFSGYDSDLCQTFRAGGERGVRVFMSEAAMPRPTRFPEVCGEGFADCVEADRRVWKQIIDAAEAADDKSSACGFTAFVGYEYTRSTNAMHLHRNTIYKNATVPDRAATVREFHRPPALLSFYEEICRQGMMACDVLSIPHNSNIAGGNAFNPRELEGYSAASQDAGRRLRRAFDRLMEITQHKGTSECLNRVTDILGDVDELCDVEAIRQFGDEITAIEYSGYTPLIFKSASPECADADFDASDNFYKGYCLSSRDFARGALLAGMAEQGQHGINPYSFGFIGSTDTHLGAAGHVAENDWHGHIAYETTLEGRLGESALGRFNRLVSNPGGLAGVYATERSRDAIFHGMKRREAFATSGPRIEPRFFAGTFPPDMCDRGDVLDVAYAQGTPMGSELPAQLKSFSFWMEAKRDPLSNPLARLQIIKGYVDADGTKHAKVIDVEGGGGERLCAVFTDPDYDPAVPSYYYLRAVETPSQRWSAQQCADRPEAERPETCSNTMPDMIYEMAWSSPIWFTPESASRLEKP